MDINIFNKIYKLHKKKLKYLSVPHKKLLICFSGIPGSGKTHIAKILEEKYKGVRINNDNIRKIISELISEKTAKDTKEAEKKRENILDKYLIWLLENNLFNNGLIILDSSIDRKYKEIFLIAKENRFDLFVVRIIVSREIAEKRAIERHGGTDVHFVSNINRWIKENEEFNYKVKTGITIWNNTVLNLNSLFEKLEKLLREAKR